MFRPIPTLETARLILRPPRPDDFEEYAAFYQTERATFRGGVKTRAEAWVTFASELGHWSLRGYGLWSVDEKDTGAYCGVVGLWNPEGWPAPEVGWLVWERYEGRGIAYEAAIRARAYAYDALGWPEIASCIADGNLRSIHLAERMGARLERRLARPGRPDVLVYRHPGPEVSRARS